LIFTFTLIIIAFCAALFFKHQPINVYQSSEISGHSRQTKLRLKRNFNYITKKNNHEHNVFLNPLAYRSCMSCQYCEQCRWIQSSRLWCDSD